jgi:hypothetical protein
MGQAIPRQQPAVVLRSHFNKMRALLAVALIAVAGLTVAVVILANDSDESAGTASAPPIGSINYGGSNSVNPSTGYPTVPFSRLAQPQSAIDGTRYDGGPDEGTRGAVRAPQATVTPETEMKDEAGTAAAIGQASGSSERSAGEGSQYGTSQYRFAQPQPDTQADELSGSKTDPRGPASLLP